MIRVIAIDDEPLALKQLTTYIQRVSFFEPVAACQSAVEAADLLRSEHVDALFCDINMPDLDGMTFVRQLTEPPLVVFTTAYSEYAVEGFRIDAVDYLLKPFGFDEFSRAAERIRQRMQLQPRTESISVRADHKTVIIPLNTIRYIQAMGEYLRIFISENQRPVMTLLSMRRLEESLPSDQFMRVHRSYIVRLSMIAQVMKGHLLLTDGTDLPLGDNYRPVFEQWMTQNKLQPAK